jgi:CBS domain-containing protein
MRVADVMTSDVVTLRRSVPFKDAVACMIDAQVSGVPVVDEEGRVIGMVTEADLMPKEVFDVGHRRTHGLGDLTGRAFAGKARGRTVGEVMTTTVHTVSPTDDLRVATRRMLEHNVKRLPVVDDGHLVGIVSRRDVLRVFALPDDELQAQIEAVLRNPLRWPPVSRLLCAVWDGRVLLEGEVAHRRDVDVIGALVGGISGVVSVHNNLHVRPRGGLVLEEREQEVLQ